MNLLEKYINNLKTSYVSPSTLNSTKNLLNKMNLFFLESNYSLSDFNDIETIISFFSSLGLKSKNSLAVNLSIFKKFYNYLITQEIVSAPFTVKIKDLEHLVLEFNNIKYVTKDELYDLMSQLKNSQDKVILLLSYLGLTGKEASDVRLLKISDIDFKNNIIKLDDRIFKFDYRDSLILKAAISESEYEYYTKNESSCLIRTNEPLVKSDYLVQGVKNINGPLSYNSFKSRYVEYNNCLKSNLSPISLKNSMIAENIIKLQNNNPNFTRKLIDSYLANLYETSKITIDINKLYGIINVLKPKLNF